MDTSSIDECLKKLSTSPFRSKFHLKAKDVMYVKTKGVETIKSHAYDFITKRLALKDIPNDGKQTPMRNHPVFIAQHATATCCRGCLNKWWKIPKNRELTEDEIDFVVELIMAYIKKEMEDENN